MQVLGMVSLLVQTQTTLVVFSWNDNDPTAEDGSDATRHQTRGSASVNLLGGLVNPPPEPSDTQSFTLTVNNVCNDNLSCRVVIFYVLAILFSHGNYRWLLYGNVFPCVDSASQH